jgi:peptidoglycan/xylan/chitin deacetylase (PgdA/CDA1 family)
VHIGNHTADHAILTNYSDHQVRAQIEAAQEGLETILGSRPSMISYPNGNYSASIVRIARESGLALGVTVDGRKSPARPDTAERLRLGRFCFTRGHDDEDTYRGFRSTTSPKRLAKQALSMVRPSRRA